MCNSCLQKKENITLHDLRAMMDNRVCTGEDCEAWKELVTRQYNAIVAKKDEKKEEPTQ